MPRRTRCKGSTIIEFALMALLLLAVLFGSIEMDRMLLTYTTLANAARAGVRYAIVNGYYATGTTYTTTSTQAIQTVATQFAGLGMLDQSTVTVTVAYPDSNNNIGSRVSVTVTAPFHPFTSFFPLSVTMGSTAEARFCY
jgi:Flp pilus assembly protein TadG